MPSLIAAGLALVMSATFLACQADGPSGDDIVVRVEITDGQLVVEPKTVRRGPVYVEPPTGAAEFVSTMTADPARERAPLDEASLARLRRGDYEGMTFESVQGAFGGRFMRIDLDPGIYAFAIMPEDAQPGDPPTAVQVLTVEP